MKRFSEQELKQFYTGDYVENFPDVDTYQKIPKLLKYVSFNPSDVIADFGCGNGLLLDYVFDKVSTYYGVDFSQEFIERARKRAAKNNIDHAHFVCDDITHFCARNENAFDHAFTLDFSEHIYDDMFISLYSGIKHSLKDQGRLYLHTPNREFIIERLRQNNIIFRQLPEHVAVRDEAHYRRLLRTVGFHKIDVLYVPHYVQILSYLNRFVFVPIIGKFLRARLFIICEK